MTSVEKPSTGRDTVDAARDDLRGLFELETLHRRGPASLVWLARDLEFDQPVALKLMPRTPGAGAEVEEAFHRAAALVATLDHPHVVPWYSAGATDRFFWCSMEYVGTVPRGAAALESAHGTFHVPASRRTGSSRPGHGAPARRRPRGPDARQRADRRRRRRSGD